MLLSFTICRSLVRFCFFFQAEDGIRYHCVTGVQTCALPIFLHRQLVSVAENERLHPFLLGVAAGVIGLIAAVTVQIVKTSVVDVYTGLLAVGGFLALNRWHSKLTVLWVVLGCGAIGALLQATVV